MAVLRQATQTDVDYYAALYPSYVRKMQLTDWIIDGTGNLYLRHGQGNIPAIGPGTYIYIKGNVYSNMLLSVADQWIGTAQDPIVITNYDGQAEMNQNVSGATNTYRLSLSGGQHIILTGEYDPLKGTGDPNYPGHKNGYAFTQGKYGIFLNNALIKNGANLLGLGDSPDAETFLSKDWTIRFIESGNGGFAAFNVKENDVSDTVDNMTNIILEHNYLHDTLKGEGFYIGSTKTPPQHSFNGLIVRYNRLCRIAAEGIQLGRMAGNCQIYNNFDFLSGLEYLDPFQKFQDGNIQYGFRIGDNPFYNNIVMGGADQLIQFFNDNSGTFYPRNALYNDVYNNFFGYGKNFLSYVNAATDGQTKMRFRDNYVGKFKYRYDRISTRAEYTYYIDIANTTNEVVVENNVVDDNSKNFVKPGFGGNATVQGNTIDTSLPEPEFVNSGLPIDFDYSCIEIWTYEKGTDVGFSGFETKKGEATFYDSEVTAPDGIAHHVVWEGKLYKCLQYHTANTSDLGNTGTYIADRRPDNDVGPSPTPDANGRTQGIYWELVWFADGQGGWTTQWPDDPTLVEGSFYQTKNIGIPALGSTNQPPTAEAGNNAHVVLPASSTLLDGSASTDDTGITSYLWDQVSGPNTATLNTPDQVTCTASGLIEGTYVFRLTVGDGEFIQNDTVQITVGAAPRLRARKNLLTL